MNENDYKIYIHINKENGKVYIGQTVQSIKRRWKNGTAYKGCRVFYRAIKKYGWDNFEHIVLADNLTKDRANTYEKSLIKQYKSNDRLYGYNLDGGGSDKKAVSEETKRLISEKCSGENSYWYGVELSDEHKKKIKDGKNRLSREEKAEIGKKISMAKKGKPLSEETKLKLSKANKGKARPQCGHDKNRGRKISEDTRLKISMANTGRVKTDEEIKKLSDANRGGNNWASIQIVCDNIVYDCISDCADFYGVNRDSMRMWLRGDRAMPKRFIDMGLNYLDVNLRIGEFKIQKEHGHRSRKVVCVNTDEIFDSILLAKEKYEAFNIASCCKNKVKSAGKHPITGERLKWMYYEDYIKLNEEMEVIYNG